MLEFISTIFIGFIVFLIVRQYRRVQNRDALRRRVQHCSAQSSAIITCDPLDHSLYWYPVALSRELLPGASRPLGIRLLNEPLCLFRDKKENVICVVDVCPHRSAPLSLGQITADGNLECIYHGWQYGSNGQCVYIPSVSKTSKTASLICARTRPVHEQYGFIWVWPGKKELAHSDRIPHQLFADIQNDQDSFLMTPDEYYDLDQPYDLMVDNLLDMAHVDFTHDGTIGKRSNAGPMRAIPINPSPFVSTNREAFTFRIERIERETNDFSYFNFIPPCFIRLDHYQSVERKRFFQIFIIVPCEDNRMRLLSQFYRDFARWKFIEFIPGYDYLAERFIRTIVNQDLLLLDGIHRNVSLLGAPVLGNTVSADAPIRAFRRFQNRSLEKYGRIFFDKDQWKSQYLNVMKNEQIDIEDLIVE